MSPQVIGKLDRRCGSCAGRMDWITGACRCTQTQANRKTETERQAEPVEGIIQVDRKKGWYVNKIPAKICIVQSVH